MTVKLEESLVLMKIKTKYFSNYEIRKKSLIKYVPVCNNYSLFVYQLIPIKMIKVNNASHEQNNCNNLTGQNHGNNNRRHIL